MKLYRSSAASTLYLKWPVASAAGDAAGAAAGALGLYVSARNAGGVSPTAHEDGERLAQGASKQSPERGGTTRANACGEAGRRGGSGAERRGRVTSEDEFELLE